MESCKQALCAIDKAAPLLVTGAKGFVGRNLVATLQAEGYSNVMQYDIDSDESLLAEYAAKAQFVFHLAGVNRPDEAAEFYEGNTRFTENLLALLSEAASPPPVLISSSTQVGNGTDYAKSKEQAEQAVFEYGSRCGKPVFVFRLPGVFGKWSRPSYNTVVATFCHNIARGMPIEVREPAFTIALCYVDDVVQTFITVMNAAEGTLTTPGSGKTHGITPTYEVTLGWLAGTIRNFAKTRQSLAVPDMSDECTRKLWATYLSFLPTDGYSYPLKTNSDERGSFTEFLRSSEAGQISVNITKPGITKGNHWHNTKNEKFLVVSGRAVIRFRTISTADIIEYTVSGEQLQVLDIPPGTTHNIQNIGEGDLVTVMWASQPFDPEAPDTYFEEV